MRRCLHGAAILVLMSLSCDNVTSTTEPLTLSWRFVDGRSCDLAGVVDVVLREAGSTGERITFRCIAGLLPDRFQEAHLSTRPVTLTLEGQSITGAALYRGQLELDDDSPSIQEVTLRFVGGR